MVELIGIPGSGKSTLAKRLASLEPGTFAYQRGGTATASIERPARRHDARSVRIACRAAEMWWRAPILSLRLLMQCGSGHAPIGKRLRTLVSTYVQLTTSYVPAKRHDPISITDEGVLHGLAILQSYAGSCPPQGPKLELLQSLAPYIRTVVMLDVPIDVALARIGSRPVQPGSRFNDPNAQGTVDRLTRFATYLELTYAALVESEIPTLRVSGELAVDALCQRPRSAVISGGQGTNRHGLG